MNKKDKDIIIKVIKELENNIIGLSCELKSGIDVVSIECNVCFRNKNIETEVDITQFIGRINEENSEDLEIFILNKLTDYLNKIRKDYINKIRKNNKGNIEEIIFSLVNPKGNEEKLKKVPHFYFLNLAVTYKKVKRKAIKIKDNKDNIIGYSFSDEDISNEMIKEMKTDKEELYHMAKDKTKDFLEFAVDKHVLGDIKTGEVLTFYSVYSQIPMLPTFGTTALLYPEIFRKISEVEGSNLIIHAKYSNELIVHSEKCKVDVTEIYYNLLKKEDNNIRERLTDSKYYYNRETEQISMLGFFKL